MVSPVLSLILIISLTINILYFYFFDCSWCHLFAYRKANGGAGMIESDIILSVEISWNINVTIIPKTCRWIVTCYQQIILRCCISWYVSTSSR